MKETSKKFAGKPLTTCQAVRKSTFFRERHYHLTLTAFLRCKKTKMRSNRPPPDSFVPLINAQPRDADEFYDVLLPLQLRDGSSIRIPDLIRPHFFLFRTSPLCFWLSWREAPFKLGVLLWYCINPFESENVVRSS